MKNSTIIITLVISLALIATYYVPMWIIDLDAPQYPEGLGFQIWLGEIKGDLNTINNLNHYIGMKTIEPESMKEFQMMPYLMGVLIGLGIIVALLRNKWGYAVWAISFVSVCILGLADFYWWEYDYGHDLDPMAAIQVPGMTYQPPLIGKKDLLNFTAYSYPATGGIIIIVSATLASLMLFFELKRPRGKKQDGEDHGSENGKLMVVKNLKQTAALLALFLFVACEVEPQPIKYGTDQCSLCKMSISDSRYGSELLTKKGKVYKFDSIECLIDFLHEGTTDNENIHSLLITDFTNPGNLVDAKTSHYLISQNMPSPMGAFLTGFTERETARDFQRNNPGEIYSWDQLCEKFNK